MDKDGSLNGYDKELLEYLKSSKLLDDKEISVLYAGGIKYIDNELIEIEEKYSFIKGVSISTLFYNYNYTSDNILYNKIINNKNSPLYFLSYLKGNIESVIKYYSKTNYCIKVDSIKDIPINAKLCINGHYNSYELLSQLKKYNDYYMLSKRLLNNTLRFIGICAGLQY